MSARKGRELLALSLLLTAICMWVVLSAIPGLSSDRGVFSSVAERLARGDVLYAGVWDNKDPLFFYVLAVGHLIHPVMDYIIELMWLAAAGAGAFLVARTRDLPLSMSALLAGAIPLLCVGGTAPAGYSHLPGTAVGLLAIGSLLMSRFGLAGFLTGTLAFLKFTTLPVVGLVMLVLLVQRRSASNAARWALGATASATMIIALLLVRGEFIPWLHAMAANVGYAGSGGSVTNKLGMVFEDPSTWSVAAVLALLVTIGRTRRDLDAQDRSVRSAGEAAALGGVVVLAVTGLWPQHAQVLFLASALLIVLVAPKDLRAIGTLALVGAALLGGGVSPGKAMLNAQNPVARINALSTPPAVSRELASTAEVKTYARLGGNDDGGHALGLGRLELLCPVFHQYSTDSPQKLLGTAECVREADAIIVGRFFSPQDGRDDWNYFVRRAQGSLHQEFDCTLIGRDQLCLRRGPKL